MGSSRHNRSPFTDETGRAWSRASGADERDTVPAGEGRRLPSVAAPHNGDSVDSRYELVRELGRGGMGIVFLAEDPRLRRSVAIKFLGPHATDLDAERFLREAHLLASLSHPHVVKVFDLGQQNGRPYFVMEYMRGPTLAEHLEAVGVGLALPEALRLGRHLCQALAAVHRQGIIHRDVKPQNVIVADQDRAVLMDFGLARSDAAASDQGLLAGTPNYLAPEDVRGRSLSGEMARRSDIYSLGATLFELLAGRPPFIGISPAEVLHKHLYEAPTRLGALRPDVPPTFERVIMRALEKDPADRQASCDELLDDLSWARASATRSGPLSTPPPGDHGDDDDDDLNEFLEDTAATPAGRRVHETKPHVPAHDAREEGLPPVVALVLNGGPMRESLAESMRVALPGCELAVLPAAAMPIRDALTVLQPACVVIDMDLLDDSPVELCALLRSRPESAFTSILVVADELAPAEEQLLARMGVDQIIPKPIDVARLAVDIERAIDD